MKLAFALLAAALTITAQNNANNSPITPMRMKISAGDVSSAESLLEVYRLEKGEDGTYLDGLAWLSRGWAMSGEWAKASRYAAEVLRRCEEKRKGGATVESLQGPIGSAVEVEAQALQAKKGEKAAARYLEKQLAAYSEPLPLRSRLYKRLNSIALKGKAAPPFGSEDMLAGTMPATAGKPVLLFLWAHWCGDCRAQIAALAKVKAKYASSELVIVAPTRHYEKDRKAEREKMQKVWAETYKTLNGIAVPVSDGVMERYGVSSTPTFATIDRKGKIHAYLPSRLTEETLSQVIEEVLRR